MSIDCTRKPERFNGNLRQGFIQLPDIALLGLPTSQVPGYL